MLFLLLTILVQIIGGSALVRHRGSAVVLVLAVACCAVTFFAARTSSLPHLVRRPGGRLEPTVGMIVGELDVLLALNGLVTLLAVFAICRYGKIESCFRPEGSHFFTAVQVSLLAALLFPLSSIVLALLMSVLRG